MKQSNSTELLGSSPKFKTYSNNGALAPGSLAPGWGVGSPGGVGGRGVEGWWGFPYVKIQKLLGFK